MVRACESQFPNHSIAKQLSVLSELSCHHQRRRLSTICDASIASKISNDVDKIAFQNDHKTGHLQTMCVYLTACQPGEQDFVFTENRSRTWTIQLHLCEYRGAGNNCHSGLNTTTTDFDATAACPTPLNLNAVDACATDNLIHDSNAVIGSVRNCACDLPPSLHSSLHRFDVGWWVVETISTEPIARLIFLF